MSDFSAMVLADRRLVILRVLQQSAGYAANEHLLRSMASSLGHQVGADRLRADLSDLAEMGLVGADTVAGVVIATLTQKGADVVSGAVSVPGVKRPLPGL